MNNNNFNQQQMPMQQYPQQVPPPKKKKKGLLIAVIAVIVIILIAAAAGGGSKDSDKAKDSDKKAITQTSETSAVSDDKKEDSKSEDEQDGTGEKSEAKTKAELPTIEEQVCFDKNDIKVTAVSIEEEMFGGKYIKLLVENNSKKNYTIGCSALIVNNCMISDLFASQVAAGKKSNEKLYLSSSDLEASGIENIGQIEIYFHMYEETNIMDSVDIDPVVIKTSAFDKMDAKPDDTGHELYNKNGLRIVGKYVDEDSFWGKSILLYIENKTGKLANISCEDLSINGFMVSEFFTSTVYNEKYAIDAITLLKSDLEENNITSIDDVELKFKIYYDKDFLNSETTDPIKFSTKS